MFWTDIPFEREKHDWIKKTDPVIRRMIEDRTFDTTDQFHEDLKLISASNQNVIFSFVGKPGSGKSYGEIYTAEAHADYLGNDALKIEYCNFTLTDSIKCIENVDEKGIIVINDEQVRTSGKGSKTELEQFNNNEATMRKHKISFFHAAPYRFNHPQAGWLVPWEMGSSEPWILDGSVRMEDQWEWTKHLRYATSESPSGMPVGHVITGTPQDKKFLEQYEQKKDDFLKQLRQGRGANRRENYIISKVDDILTWDGKVNDRDFLTKFMELGTKRLRTAHLMNRLGSPQASVDEQKLMTDELMHRIKKDDELLRKMMQIKAIQKKRKKEWQDLG